jgi:hypothetical protein
MNKSVKHILVKWAKIATNVKLSLNFVKQVKFRNYEIILSNKNYFDFSVN